MTLRAAFVGPRGLRAGWSLGLAFAIFTAFELAGTWLASKLLGGSVWRMTAPVLLAGEVLLFGIAAVTVAIMGRIERRAFARYGLPWRGGSRRLGEGTLWGILSIGALILLIAVSGGYSVTGVALHGGDLVVYTALWALAFLFVGLFEELLFRGYALFTLARGIGFWPAALVLSAYFGFVLHFLQKPNETWVDGLSVTLVALFFCLTVRRTGDLWFAIGWHFAFNFGSMFVFGSPNTANDGRPVEKHLLESTFHGPEWLTGGAMGPEASAWVFVVIAMLFLLFSRRFRQAKFPVLEEPPARGGGEVAAQA